MKMRRNAGRRALDLFGNGDTRRPGMSIPSPSPTALALVAGLAVAGLAAPQSARADSFSFGFSVGERDGWRVHREPRGARPHTRPRPSPTPPAPPPLGPPPSAFPRPPP